MVVHVLASGSRSVQGLQVWDATERGGGQSKVSRNLPIERERRTVAK